MVALPPIVIAGIFGVFTLLGIGTVITGMKKYLLAQKIMNTPTSKVRSVAIGLVELFGKAQNKEEIISPISKTPCAYWLVVAKYRKKKKRGHTWRTFFKQGSKKQFYIKDNTGKMLIDPDGAELDVESDRYFSGRIDEKGLFGFIKFKKLDQNVLTYLKNNEQAKKAFEKYEKKKLRVYEHYIKEGDKTYVLGTATTRDKKASEVAHQNLVIKKGLNNILYIGDKSEKTVLGRLGLSVGAHIVFGIILTLVSGIFTWMVLRDILGL